MSKDAQGILEDKVGKTLSVLKEELNGVRAGRAREFSRSRQMLSTTIWRFTTTNSRSTFRL